MASLTRMFRLCQETHQTVSETFGEANSSNIVFEVLLAFRWWKSGLISHKDSQLHNKRAKFNVYFHGYIHSVYKIQMCWMLKLLLNLVPHQTKCVIPNSCISTL